MTARPLPWPSAARPGKMLLLEASTAPDMEAVPHTQSPFRNEGHSTPAGWVLTANSPQLLAPSGIASGK